MIDIKNALQDPLLHIGLGLLNQPTFGQGLASGFQSYQGATMQALQQKLMNEQLKQSQARNELGGIFAQQGNLVQTPEQKQAQLSSALAAAGEVPSAIQLLGDEPSKWINAGDRLIEIDSQGPTGQEVPIGAKPEALGQKRDRNAKLELSLADDYHRVSAPFIDVQSAYERVKTALKSATTSAASTLAAGTSFMKMLDPGSVVRESELGMALSATGAWDRATNYFYRLQNGGVLTKRQQDDFSNITDRIYEAALSVQKKVNDTYTNRAKNYGLNPENIVTNYNFRKLNNKANAGRNPGNNKTNAFKPIKRRRTERAASKPDLMDILR